MKKSFVFIASIVTAAAAAVAVGAAYLLLSKKEGMEKLHLSIDDIEVEKLDGIVRLEDIVNWFKSLSLVPEVHTPFIINGDRVQELFDDIQAMEDAVLIGVYDERKNKMRDVKILQGAAFDKALHDVLAKASKDNPIIVLN